MNGTDLIHLGIEIYEADIFKKIQKPTDSVLSDPAKYTYRITVHDGYRLARKIKELEDEVEIVNHMLDIVAEANCISFDEEILRRHAEEVYFGFYKGGQ